jgi:hypothetical protein
LQRKKYCPFFRKHKQIKIMTTPSFLNNTLKLAFVASSLFFASCSEDNLALETTEEDIENTEYSVTVNSTNTSIEREIDILALADSTVPVIVNFTKENDNMDRLYVTQTTSGSTEGSVVYNIDPEDLLKLDTKIDGSLDLDGEQEDAFSFTINFPAPSAVNSTVQYVLWTTEGRGDYRDITNDNSFENKSTYAVITITAGTPADLSGIREFEQTISLDAPLANGNSISFVSVFNGQEYSISNAIETAAFWDFGYFYDNTLGASFYSTATFPSSGFTGTVETVTGLERTELNKCYFGKSNKTVAQFDAINTTDGLNNLLTDDSNQDTSSLNAVNALEIDDVVAFLDQYGNKGLIKITALTKGNGTAGKITFEVKIQTKATPILAL